MKEILVLIFLTTFSLSIIVRAQTSVRTEGSIKVGEDTRICDSSIEGAMRYNPVEAAIEVCKDGGSGYAWTKWGE
jgi:hypothetical protein